MEQPEEPASKPSVFRHSLAGYLTACSLAIPVIVAMSIRAGDFNEPAAFQVLVFAGTIGATIGFEIAARRLKRFGGGGMTSEWKHFWGSPRFYGLTAIILGGAIGITLLGSLIALAVMEPPGQ